MIGEPILVCRQEISFSNDFGCRMEAGFDIVFDLQDVEEGERMVEFFQRQHPGYKNGIRPLRIMRAGMGEIIREYEVETEPQAGTS